MKRFLYLLIPLVALAVSIFSFACQPSAPATIVIKATDIDMNCREASGGMYRCENAEMVTYFLTSGLLIGTKWKVQPR